MKFKKGDIVLSILITILSLGTCSSFSVTQIEKFVPLYGHIGQTPFVGVRLMGAIG